MHVDTKWVNICLYMKWSEWMNLHLGWVRNNRTPHQIVTCACAQAQDVRDFVSRKLIRLFQSNYEWLPQNPTQSKGNCCGWQSRTSRCTVYVGVGILSDCQHQRSYMEMSVVTLWLCHTKNSMAKLSRLNLLSSELLNVWWQVHTPCFPSLHSCSNCNFLVCVGSWQLWIDWQQ